MCNPYRFALVWAPKMESKLNLLYICKLQAYLYGLKCHVIGDRLGQGEANIRFESRQSIGARLAYAISCFGPIFPMQL